MFTLTPQKCREHICTDLQASATPEEVKNWAEKDTAAFD